MKIIVPLKQVIDPNLVLSLKKDGSGFEDDGLNREINPFDLVALEAALSFKDKGLVTEVVAVTFGPVLAEKTLRQAYALGVTRAVRIEGEGCVFEALASFCRQEKPDLILCGKQAVDDDLSETGPLLATDLDIPFETNISNIKPEDGKVVISKESDNGRETLSLPLPCLLAVDLTLCIPRLATVPQILKAKSKVIEVFPFQGVFKDVRQIVSYFPPVLRPACQMVSSLSHLKKEIA